MQNQSDAADGAVSTVEEALRASDHRLLAEIAGTRAYLEQDVDEVATRLAKIHPLSCAFDGAVKRAARAAGVDPMDASFDPVQEALSKVFGIGALYDLAGRLERALPDNCDCQQHGCADLAGIPSERAD